MFRTSRLGLLRSPNGVRIENERRPWVLGEVEVVREVAEDRCVFADVGACVWSAVGARIEPLAAEEVVLDELRVGVEAERLMVDVAALRVGADHDPRDAQAIAVRIDRRRITWS